MSKRIRIEVQDQFGAWRVYTHTTANPSSVKLALNQAVKSQLAQKSKKARAIDPDTGALVDMVFG